MNYELAKQLKDAGFPDGGRLYVNEAVHIDNKLKRVNYRGVDLEDDETGDRILFPTLSELIEACGDGFGMAKSGDGTWRCFSDSNGLFKADGETPEESVARLWLQLRAK